MMPSGVDFSFLFLFHDVCQNVPQLADCACCRAPSSSKAIQSRLEVVLHLLGQLMAAVQLQHTTLLVLSRVACQTLTVEGVDLLQIKAAGQASCTA